MNLRDLGSSFSNDTADSVLAAGPRARWLADIEESIAALQALNKSSEEGFLAVGSHLQSIYARTMGISDTLTHVVKNFSSEEQDRLTAELRNITETSGRYLGNFDETSRNAVSHLATVLEITDELPERLKEFERMVSQLRIMGITTRIETERLGLTNMGFEHLADDVTALGENISSKTKEVQTSIRTILGIVKQNEQNLVGLRGKHEELRRSVGKTMNDDLQLLSEKHEVLVKVVEDITRQSQDAIHCVNTIVGALQFHDITRQQIEHVIEALQALSAHLTDDAAGDALSHLIVVCELQPVQLHRARTEFSNALLSLISSFGNMSNTITMMQKESREAIGFAAGDGTTFFSVIGENLRNVTMALAGGEAGIREILDSLQQIEHEVHKMIGYMEEMSDAGDEVELLALNSRVRAAKTRERGAALGVIAESIQRIATLAEAYITEVVGSIDALAKKTNEMHELANRSDFARTAESSVHEMTSHLSEMIDVFATSSTTGTNTLKEAEQSSALLIQELDVMACAIFDNRLTGETIERIEKLLSSIVVEARADAPEFVLSEVALRLEEMTNRYTMLAERDTHAGYVEGNKAPAANSVVAESSIELF
jgi:hypothetical protein